MDLGDIVSGLGLTLTAVLGRGPERVVVRLENRSGGLFVLKVDVAAGAFVDDVGSRAKH